MKKRLAAIVLSAMMAASLLACGSSDSSAPASTDSAAETTEAAAEDDGEAVGQADVYFAPAEVTKFNPDELDHHKIAFSYYAFSDKLGSQFQKSIQYLADAYNCDVVFFESGSSTDDQVTNLESVLSAGDIEGVIYVGGSPALVDVANKYGAAFVSACGFPSTEEEIKGVASYDNYLGGVIDDDVWAGEQVQQALYDAGCRNIAFSGLTQGLVKSHDDRAQAMRDFVASHDDYNLLADNYSWGEAANDVATFHASFPELDGIGFSAIGDEIYLALESEGLTDGSIKIAGVDISSQTGIYFQNGVQVWTCGGQYATAETAFAVLYNYLSDGTRIITDTSTPLIRKYIAITSYDDYKNYVQYVEGDVPTYTADEIADMIHVFNPDITYADYETYADTYSLEDIISRR